jgi:hypothetical protein
MTVKIKFLNPVSKNKFLHNLVNSRKINSYYRHFPHKLLNEATDNVTFRIFDGDKDLVKCEIEFCENGIVQIEYDALNYDALQSLLVFDLLESIDEKAVVAYVDSKFYFNGGMEFYFVVEGPRQEIHKVSSNRNDLLEVTNSRTILEIKNALCEI